MLTREEVLQAIRNGRKSACQVIDSRDYSRLCDFMPVEDWDDLGFSLQDGADAPAPKEWTRGSILQQLAADLEFAVEKAEGQRGISASLMYEVVKMWLWVLEDDLQHHSDYHNYGRPFLREVQEKYSDELEKAPA